MFWKHILIACKNKTGWYTIIPIDMKKHISPTQKALNVWAIILILWSLYRAKLSLPEWFDEFVAKPLIFIAPIAYYIIKIEKKDFFSSLWLSKKNILQDLYLGLAVLVAFFLVALIPVYVKSKTLSPAGGSFDALFIQLISYLPIAVATALSEEILSRGFVLKRLFQESNSILSSSFTASVLFFILHIPILFTNLKLTGGMLILFMFTDLVLSLANSFIFLGRRSLILPILIHAFYNLTLVLSI